MGDRFHSIRLGFRTVPPFRLICEICPPWTGWQSFLGEVSLAAEIRSRIRRAARRRARKREVLSALEVIPSIWAASFAATPSTSQRCTAAWYLGGMSCRASSRNRDLSRRAHSSSGLGPRSTEISSRAESATLANSSSETYCGRLFLVRTCVRAAFLTIMYNQEENFERP